MNQPVLAERFFSKVEFTDTCWLWTGAKTTGYGMFSINGCMVLAHRYAYEFCVGPIPDGLQLDHLCRVRHCINPNHLEAVTARENILRGEGLAAQNSRKTHCPQGHRYSSENTYVNPSDNRRSCRTCNAEWQSRYKQRLKASA